MNPTAEIASPLHPLAPVEEILACLVGLRSVNPSLAGASESDNEQEVAAYVRSLLESHGITVSTQEVMPGRYNVIGHVPRGARADERTILLSAHMDTYPASEEGDGEYQARIEDDFLIGRGSADAKGSLAAMLHAFIQTSRSPGRREAYIVASVDEEYGLCGCKALALSGVRADLAITGEPTSLAPIYAQKGIVRSRVRVFGNVEHAAYPKGSNSLIQTGRVLGAIEKMNREMRGVLSNCGLTPPTITPTRIQSDGDMNKTPSEVSVWFDARTLPGLSSSALLELLEARIREVLDANVSFEVDAPYFESPPNHCELREPVVRDFLRKLEAATGRCAPAGFSYGSEAGVLSAISRASLVFGPGDASYSHGPGERVSLSEVKLAARVFADVLVNHQSTSSLPP